jgi:hypothetical protein
MSAAVIGQPWRREREQTELTPNKRIKAQAVFILKIASLIKFQFRNMVNKAKICVLRFCFGGTRCTARNFLGRGKF